MIPFVDLKAQYHSIKAEIDAAITNILENSQFVLGPEVSAFESEFAAYTGGSHSIGLNSGTSALHLALLAAGRAVTFNFFITDKLHGVDLRLITVSILVAALYSLARWVRMPKSVQETEARHAYTWVAGGSAAWLLWCELQPISVAPGLGVLALLLFEIGVWRG